MATDAQNYRGQRLTYAVIKHFNVPASENNQTALILKLRNHIDRSPSTLATWLSGTAIPPPEFLIKLAKLLNVSTDWLLCMDINDPMDEMSILHPILHVTQTQNEYFDLREKAIEKTRKTLWIQLRITHTLRQITGTILDLMRDGVRVRLLLSNPQDTSTMTQVARRGYDWLPPDDVEAAKRLTQSELDIFKDAVAGHNVADKLDIMLVDFFPSSVCYFSDIDTANGKLFAAIGNFDKNPFLLPVLMANQKNHTILFEDYCDQFIRLWNNGAKKSGEIKRMMPHRNKLKPGFIP